MGSYAIFGYGSLILPPSAISRFADLPSIDSVYEAGLEYGESGLVRPEAIAEWNRRRDDFEVIPARVRGFRRSYTYPSPRGGAMLEAVYTGDETDVLNGLLICGYSQEEYEAITESEVGYECIELTDDDFESYSGDEVSLSHPVMMYVEADVGGADWPMRQRNATYHARILTGIDMIEDAFGEELAASFRDDYVSWTFEPPLSGGSPRESGSQSESQAVRWNWMNTVQENDRARSGFQWLFE